MKTTILGLVLATAAACVLPVQNAKADSKAYAGSGCKVFGATAWTDLQFGAAGIINLTNTPKNIICPIVKDSEAAYDGSAVTPTNLGWLHVHIGAGAVASRTVCSIYEIYDSNPYGGIQHTYTIDTGALAANTDGNYDTSNFDGVSGDQHDTLMMLCTLGPRALIRYYKLSESGATN